MKKAVLATMTTLLAAGGAESQEWTATIGGFLTVGGGFIDVEELDENGQIVDDDLNPAFLIRDGEVIPRFRLTADNGLAFGVEVQIEMGDAPDLIDEAFGYVEGDFGRLELGEADGAADTFSLAGITAYTFTSATDATGVLFDYYADEVGFIRDASGENTSDSLKITYYTPTFGGFRAGASFAPSLESQNGRATDLGDEINAFEVGAQYTGEWRSVGFQIGAGYTTDTVPGEDDDQSIGGGAKISWGGFETGVSWAWNEGFGEFDDQNIFGVGAAYATGPWLASASMLYVVDGPASDTIGVGADLGYTLAPGDVVGGLVEYGDREPVDDTQDDPDSGFVGGLFMGLNF